jgi:hypothetical protein
MGVVMVRGVVCAVAEFMVTARGVQMGVMMLRGVVSAVAEFMDSGRCCCS